MAYNSLTIGLADDLLADLQLRVAQYGLSCTICTTIQETGRLLNSQVFHPLIVDLEYLRSIRQIGWLAEIRRISFVPIIILSETPDEDIKSMIHLGADLCVSGKLPYATIADLAFAQLRRYTAKLAADRRIRGDSQESNRRIVCCHLPICKGGWHHAETGGYVKNSPRTSRGRCPKSKGGGLFVV